MQKGFAYTEIPLDTSLPHGSPQRKTEAEVQEQIATFKPEDERVADVWEILQKHMEIDKLLAVEVDHCP